MKLKDIIPFAIMLEGSEFNELVMTDLGRAKFDTIYGFKGSFKYGEQDLTKVLDIMKKSVETDKYIINARGFIAGLSCEFTGEIMIGVKKQSNPDYAGKNIKLSGTGCGTIAVMEWIEAHGCPLLNHTNFMEGNIDVLMVSSHSNDLFIELDNMGKVDWIELSINGKKAYRYHESFWWIFKIDGNYYFATK